MLFPLYLLDLNSTIKNLEWALYIGVIIGAAIASFFLVRFGRRLTKKIEIQLAPPEEARKEKERAEAAGIPHDGPTMHEKVEQIFVMVTSLQDTVGSLGIRVAKDFARIERKVDSAENRALTIAEKLDVTNDKTEQALNRLEGTKDKTVDALARVEQKLSGVEGKLNVASKQIDDAAEVRAHLIEIGEELQEKVKTIEQTIERRGTPRDGSNSS